MLVRLAIVQLPRLQCTDDVVVRWCLWALFVALVAVKVLSCSYLLTSLFGSCWFGYGLWSCVNAATTAVFSGHGNHSTAGIRLGASVMAVLALLAFIAYRAEQNEAPVLRVPKRDCTYTHHYVLCASHCTWPVGVRNVPPVWRACE